MSEKCTSVDKVELSVTEYEASELQDRACNMDDGLVVKGDGLRVYGICSDAIEPEPGIGLDSTVEIVPSAVEVIIGDGRVVADLLHIHGTAVDEALKSFAQNGVEGFCHKDSQYLLSYLVWDDGLELGERVRVYHGLEEHWSVRFVFCYDC